MRGARLQDINLQMMMRERELCWAEIGNEDEEARRVLEPFEESRFYEVEKFMWNTKVPWRNKPWTGGVLLVLPKATLVNDDLYEVAVAQFERLRAVRRRPLCQATENVIKLRGDEEDRQTFEKLMRGEDVPFRRGVLCTQFHRQCLLAKRARLSDSVFLITIHVKKMPVGCHRIRGNMVRFDWTFFYVDCED